MACSLVTCRLIFPLFIALLSGLLTSEGAWQQVQHHITVNSQDGYDNSSCLAEGSIACQTLDFVLRNLQNSTQVLIEQPLENTTYSLNENHTLEYYQDIYFTGTKAGKQVSIICGNEKGLAFHFCEGITFELLNFTNCGRVQKSAPFHTYNISKAFYAGIFLANCRDFTVVNCSIFDSPGKGLVLYDVGGNVNITGSTFERNTPLYRSDSGVLSTGGGVSLQLTQYGALPPFEATNEMQLKYTTNNTYYFTENIFSENCHANDNNTEDLSLPFGRGGGLTVFLRGLSQNNTILIDRCDFVSNTALWGAGLFVVFHDNAQGNYLNIKGGRMVDNAAKYAGGAIRSGSEVHGRQLRLRENKITYEGVHFVNNSAILGGALSHFGWAYIPTDVYDAHRSLILTDCIFHFNKATIGSAIGVALNNDNEFGIGPALPFRVTLENGNFHNNTIIRTEDKVVVGMGAVYSTNVPLIFKGKNVFTDNTKTALLLDNADVKVYGFAFFFKNKGINGGAIALFGQSRIITTNGSLLLFYNNIADTKGGAIYVRAPGPAVAAFRTRQLQRHHCFLAYEDDSGLVGIEYVESWNTKLVFLNNTAADLGGDSLYATTLQACFRADEHRLNNTALDWKHVTIYENDIGIEISTDPVYINVNDSEWSVAASQVFDASVVLLDEKSNPVYGIVRIDIQSHKNVSLDLPSNLFLVDVVEHSRESKVKNLKLKGPSDTDFVITISNLDGQTINSKPTTVRLKRCNPGFNQKDDRCTCSKPSLRWMEGISHCDDDGKTVYLKTGYWGGNVSNHFSTIPCPPNYCSKDSQYNDTGYFKYNNPTMCGGDRSTETILCGKCKTNYSVNIGNENCTANSECSKDLGWQIPLFIITIPVLVLIVLRINIDIFTSYLNSWLYFYQVVHILLNRGVLNEAAALDPVIPGIIKLANLQIPGVGTCLFHNMDNLRKFGLNYVIPAYVLVSLFVITRIARYRPNCYVNNNVFRAVCTLVVLCYTNITEISFNIIYPIPVRGLWILYFDGEYQLNNQWDAVLIVLFTLAILCLIFFVFLFPLMLLFRSWFTCGCNLDAFIDIFQDCFREGFGPFAAYYFLCRIALLMVDLFAEPGPFKRCLLECFTLLILLLFVFFKPYRAADEHHKHNYTWLNIVDAVILANLCVITIMSSGQTSDAADLTRHGLKYFVWVLVWLPMVYLVGLVSCTLTQHYQAIQRHLGYQSLEDPSSNSGQGSSKPENIEQSVSNRSSASGIM